MNHVQIIQNREDVEITSRYNEHVFDTEEDTEPEIPADSIEITVDEVSNLYLRWETISVYIDAYIKC